MSQQALESVAQAMVAKGKGILAADESMGTIKRRFDSIKIESNEDNRRAYREMLFATKGVEEAVSGVIFFDETTFSELFLQRVHLEGMILKPSMVVSGKENPRQAGVEEVAQRTIQCLKRTVPAAVPGIAFLSGGQSAESATEHLNAMNAMGPHPWQVSFSYARALQDPALKAWKGEAANVPAAQKIFYHRAKCNSAARSGQYNKQMEA